MQAVPDFVTGLHRMKHPASELFALLVIYAGTALCAASGPLSSLNEREDGGPAAYATPAIPAEKSLTPAELAKEFPVAQQARIHVLGGGVRGFGMLGEFGPGGPDKIVVARHTTPGATEPYTPVALARVFDPAGNLVAIEEFSYQNSDTDCRVIILPAGGAAGIWRVSFSGGRRGDDVEIRLPATAVWGVRGEMTLGYTTGTLREGFLWLPPESIRLLVGVENGNPNAVHLLNTSDGASAASMQTDPTGRPGRLVLDPIPASRPDCLRVSVDDGFSGALVIDGAPGLFCPSAEAARHLQGGTVMSHGLRTGGPLQARVRDWMVRQAPLIERDVKFNFPESAPEDLPDPRKEALLFGKYSLLNNLGWIVRRQNETLDPASPYYGSDRPVFNVQKDEAPPVDNWSNFLPGRIMSFGFPSSFAVAATNDSPLNPMHGDSQMVLRATLGAFADIVALQGDDLMREGTMFGGRYPVTHAFFAYPSALAESYQLLKDRLDPEARELWRQGLMAVGDKLADYQAYQSNQWSHMLLGHLTTYLATGERRFLGYFERETTAYLDGAYGTAAKFGQHPAGYFLEEYGPDGNYDKLNSFALASCWLEYRDLPEANPVLLQKMHDGLARNLRFNAFFWQPQPDGAQVGPTAFNCRRMFFLGGAGYPGPFLCIDTFPLASARYALSRQPVSGSAGEGMTMSFVANTDDWAKTIIREGMKRGPDAFDAGGGGWIPRLLQSRERPAVAPARLPCEETSGSWELPGFYAWKHAGIYGVAFNDVAGADRVLDGHFGGGPTLLWTEGTGTFLAAMHAGQPQQARKLSTAEQLTFSCVYRKSGDGKLFYTGSERSTQEATTDGVVIRSPAALPKGGLEWRYVNADGRTSLHVRTTGGTDGGENFLLNLPLSLRLPGATATMEDAHTLLFKTPTGRVHIAWSEYAPGELASSALPDIRRLVIPLPADGRELVLTFTCL
jgi:hypothetical protein